MRVPELWLTHRVTIEPFLGDTTYGPKWGPAVEDVPALVSAAVTMTRDRTGAQVASTAQVIAGPDIDCPAGSRLTLPDGRRTVAISVAHHTAPGLPVPESTEVMCE
ncbi:MULTISPECIES: hypothetical protein [unclassified Streptomyces]|uniref:hypothetical protein n=1 Tax=unclassified Streptomyces TaxID=2593676 RepID=UPI00036DED50|nr:hypothetical protein [Streptomyces sp. BoleA5]